MKLNEFKTVEKLEEKLSDFAKSFGASALKSALGQDLGLKGEPKDNRSIGIRLQMAKKVFIEDFVKDALSELSIAASTGKLDTARKSKTAVNPATVSPKQPNLKKAKPKKANTSVSRSKQSKPKQSTSSPEQQKKVQQTLNNYVKGVAREINNVPDLDSKIRLTKEIVNFMADRKNHPEWDNAVGTVKHIIKKGELDPGFANAAISRLKSGKQLAESWQVHCINLLLENVGIAWEDIGLVVLNEDKRYFIAEESYCVFNVLYESLLFESPSITEYLQNWFKKYMQGVDYSGSEKKILQLIKQVENTYHEDNGKRALIALADVAWDLSKDSVTVDDLKKG